MRASLVAVMVLAGCTLDVGRGFATMESAVLSIGLDPSSSRVAGDAVLTDLGYRVELDTFELSIAGIELQALEGAAGGGTFDPARPPEGYTLCHGGHCHAEDGSLVSYEEIQAMLSGGTVRFVSLVTVPVDEAVDVLAGEALDFRRFEPSAELPRGTIARVLVEVEGLRIAGRASDAALGDETAEVAIVEPDEGHFVATVSRPLGRDHAAEIDLAVEVPIGGTFFDGVDFATSSPDPDAVLAAVLGQDIHVSFD